MELMSWAVNAIDKIYSTKKQDVGEPACPPLTHAAGYIRDGWKNWNPVCLSILSVEDAEDVWIFGFLITGFLLIGAVVFLIYRLQKQTAARIESLAKLPTLCDGLARSSQTLTQLVWDLTRRVEAVQGRVLQGIPPVAGSVPQLREGNYRVESC